MKERGVKTRAPIFKKNLFIKRFEQRCWKQRKQRGQVFILDRFSFFFNFSNFSFKLFILFYFVNNPPACFCSGFKVLFVKKFDKIRIPELDSYNKAFFYSVCDILDRISSISSCLGKTKILNHERHERHERKQKP